MEPRVRGAISVLGIALALALCGGRAHAVALNGRWRLGNEIFEIVHTGSAVSFTLFGLAYSGSVDTRGELSVTATTPDCPPYALIRARMVAGGRLDGASVCTILVSRFLVQRCECIDGNANNGDGCDDDCQIEPCFSCAGDPFVCTPLSDGASCSDGQDCTINETCSGAVCGGGVSVPNCTDLTGRWLLRTRDSIVGPFETKVDLFEVDRTLEFRDPMTGSLGFFGTVDPYIGAISVAAPALYWSCAEDLIFDTLIGGTSLDGKTWIGSATGHYAGSPGGATCFPYPGTMTGTRCGGGTLDAGEECDDGNGEDGDGCSSLCRIEGAASVAENLKCYRVNDLAYPPFARSSAGLTDAFAVNDGAFAVRKPFLFCTPVSKDGQPIVNPDAHVTCYKIRGPWLSSSARPRIEVGNDLGPLQLEVKQPHLLCVRSTKTPLP